MKRNISKIALIAMFAILGACSNGPDKGKEGGSTTTPPTNAQIRADYIKEVKRLAQTATGLKDPVAVYGSDIYVDSTDQAKVVSVTLTYGEATKPTAFFTTHIEKKNGKYVLDPKIETTTTKNTLKAETAPTTKDNILYSGGTAIAKTDDIPNFSNYKLYTYDTTKPFYTIATADSLTVLEATKWESSKLTLEAKDVNALTNTIHVLQAVK